MLTWEDIAKLIAEMTPEQRTATAKFEYECSCPPCEDGDDGSESTHYKEVYSLYSGLTPHNSPLYLA